jgi:Ser/Thr protein kinase RdoA (MazF antagonist)
MDARWSASDAPGGELLAEVAERYGLRFPITARRLTGGYANDVFRLDSAGPPAVLHVKHPPADGDSMDWEHRLLAELSVHLPEALPPIPAVDGSTWFWFRGRPTWLVSWVPGGPAGPADRRAVATVLGRLHSCPAKVSSRPSHSRLLQLPLPPVRQLPAALAPWRTALVGARAELTNLVRWLEHERRPVTGPTHNDIFPGNVLVHRRRVTAVLDWEEADVDWQVWDLARSLWPFCARGDRLDDQAVAEFVAAYLAAGGPVPPDEDDLIMPLIAAGLILEVLRAPNDRHPQWDHQLANMRAYAALGATASNVNRKYAMWPRPPTAS